MPTYSKKYYNGDNPTMEDNAMPYTHGVNSGAKGVVAPNDGELPCDNMKNKASEAHNDFFED